MLRDLRKLVITVFLTLFASSTLLFAPSLQSAEASERRLRIYSVNTKERIDVIYKRDGDYVPDALDKIDWIMRDWRRDEKIKVSRELIDLLWEVHKQLDSKEPIHLISGYRSQKTNNKLRRTKGGQARKSQHILGNAADVHFPDVPVKRLRNAGLIRQYGGVGYYPGSAIPFVHLDVARVRHWPRLPRQELALLFPSAETKHVPADGRPLRKEDVKKALANLENDGKPLPWATRQQLKQVPRPVLASLGPVASSFGVREEDSRPASSETASVPAPAEVAPANEPRADLARASLEGNGFDDPEHEGELYYQPLPLREMITDRGVASMDFTSEMPDMKHQAHLLFADAQSSIAFTFEGGLQYGKLYRASRFSGRAISGVLKRRETAGRATPKRSRLAQR